MISVELDWGVKRKSFSENGVNFTRFLRQRRNPFSQNGNLFECGPRTFCAKCGLSFLKKTLLCKKGAQICRMDFFAE